ncbi:MAG: PDZ domain-containing protein [Nannocystaceae bacterium]
MLWMSRRGAQAPLLGLLLLSSAGCSRGASEPGAEAGAEAEAERAKAAALAAPVSDAFTAALSAGIRVHPDDPSTVEVDSFVATVVVEALLSGTTGLEISPRLDSDGATQGYSVAKVPPGGPFARLGLRDGDVLAAINGVGLTSPGRALAALQTAQRHVVVAVERDDAAILYDLRLVDGLAWAQTLAAQGAGAGDGVALAPSPTIVAASTLVAAVEDDALADVADAAPPVVTPSAAASGASTASGAAKATAPKTSAAKASAAKTTGGSASATASCSAPDVCTLRRSELDRILGNPSLASKQVRYTPHIQGGKHRGYRLTSVTPGSSVAALGFAKGDVITTVNGHSLTDEGELFALYMGLSGTTTHKIRYQRGGATRVKTIRVQ